MRSPCAAMMQTARELLDYGVLPEGSKELAELRGCANTCGCEEWQDCREQTAGAWRQTNPEALPAPVRREGVPAAT
jgi:hypothetical protein